MKAFVLRRIAIIVAVVIAVVGGTGIATDAFAHGSGGGGGAFAGGHFGGMGGGHFGGVVRAREFGGRAVRRRFSRVRGDGYYDGSGYDDNGYYDPSTVAPDEGPTYPTQPYPNMNPPRRSGCSTQTYKVPSEGGGQASVNVVRCWGAAAAEKWALGGAW
jgi:hypothetical protein